MRFGVFPVAPCRRTCPRCRHRACPSCPVPHPSVKLGQSWGSMPEDSPSPWAALEPSPCRSTPGVPAVIQHGRSPGGFRGVLQPAHRRLHTAASSGAALQAPGVAAVSGTRVPFKINSTKDAGAGWFPPRVADCNPAGTAPPAPAAVLPRHKATLPSA